MTANSADAQKLRGPLDGDGDGAHLVKQSPNAAAPVVYGDFLFTEAAALGNDGKIKVWSGAAWQAKPVKWWSGAAWVEKPLKHWTGAAWVLVNGD